MKIYLAATAPGNEYTYIQNRLLSYFLIQKKIMENDKVFKQIKDENLFSRSRTSQPKGIKHPSMFIKLL